MCADIAGHSLSSGRMSRRSPLAGLHRPSTSTGVRQAIPGDRHAKNRFIQPYGSPAPFFLFIFTPLLAITGRRTSLLQRMTDERKPDKNTGTNRIRKMIAFADTLFFFFFFFYLFRNYRWKVVNTRLVKSFNGETRMTWSTRSDDAFCLVRWTCTPE